MADKTRFSKVVGPSRLVRLDVHGFPKADAFFIEDSIDHRKALSAANSAPKAIADAFFKLFQAGLYSLDYRFLNGRENKVASVCGLIHVIFIILFIFFLRITAFAESFLIPMDTLQKDQCRGYGLVYQCLGKKAPNVAWLLNYRGGSFFVPVDPAIKSQAEKMGVSLEAVSSSEQDAILSIISEENMDVVPLEIAPKVGIYLPTPLDADDDVVANTLRYAGIPYITIYDPEILDGKLSGIDWLHIHHKDFTGQGHRRPGNQGDLSLANDRGFSKTWMMKQAVSAKIREFVENGGFLFAMCSAAETIDISLAANGIDIVPAVYDGDSSDPDGNEKLDFKRTFAFSDFKVFLCPGSEYSDIDVPSAGNGTQFKLFQFSATVDPVPCLLNQNHVEIVPGFGGETSSFRRSLVKKDITILADNNDGVSVRYLTGNAGKGVFCFYGGHTPAGFKTADFRENSPGFRLILNNVLFPSAKTRKRKT